MTPNINMTPTEDVFIRLERKTRIEGECRIWTGKTVTSAHGDKKYGCIWYQGKTVRIGRLICHLYHGAILEDNSWTANHTRNCTSSLCWNPQHLYVGTPQQNVADQIATGDFHYGTDNLNGGFNFHKQVWLDSKTKKGK